MQEKRSTEELNRLIAECGDLDDALEEANSDITRISPSQRLNVLLVESKMEIRQIAQMAGLSTSYTYQIFEGVRVPGREAVLRLAFAMHLKPREAQHLLRIAKEGALYSRVRRDFIILFALEQGATLQEADALLTERGETGFP